MIKYETERYKIFNKDKGLYGIEKKHDVLKQDKTVFIQDISEKKNLYSKVSEAFDKIHAETVIKKGDHVAIKLNIGGGIDYIQTSFSDPFICEAIIKKTRKMGALPFICEANMRARIMDEKLLKVRGYEQLCKKMNCKFVNLSDYTTVNMKCLNLDIPLKLPEILVKPETKIISFAPPKHHWECGLTANQKNMYGAIAEFRKSIYHRKYSRIDYAVAAAARIISPDINILGSFNIGTGVGPHFMYPVEFNRMIISKDMLRGDKVASELLGYPFQYIKYCMINSKNQPVDYRLHPDSSWLSVDRLHKIKKKSMDYRNVNLWKAILYLQYFLPHYFQIWLFPRMESLFTEINMKFFDN
ncbi:MAG: hypothetical protein BAJALOKI3v1_20035 [Promethearchaeota archaeon]|nr:MAG: hypothetical protein BAJALOKI3v1_20035 [Candidatus Lokiarchaeota archaeon]